MITKIIDEKLIKQLLAFVEESDKIVITCHIAPDGDAMGSSLGAVCYTGVGADEAGLSRVGR
ncbi:MAG: hypothetical protein K2H61_05500, partial [Muribaculaceae bacterium]|nr:hypothetical protein [Muribaculaceae bacterium]